MAVQPRVFVCTLFEGQHHYGIGALLNSLYHSGFRGDVIIGSRGELPPWAGAAAGFDKPMELPGAEGMRLRFFDLRERIHFCNYKPTFLLRGFEEFCPGSEMGFYFDPDILVRCGWEFFEKWVEVGVALCEDMFPRMPPTHPHRAAWVRHAAPLQLQVHRQLEGYLNSGFIGLRSRNRGFLELWQRLLAALGEEKLTKYQLGGRDQPFCKPDQEMLNAAAMMTEEPLSVIGPDGMGFSPGADSVMLHAAGGPKPWQKKMLWRTLKTGRRPTMADREFYLRSQHPIRLFSGAEAFWRKLDLRLGCAVGRYFG